MLRMHIWLALIASQAAAIVETTRFTRAKGPDGSDGKYISLDSEHSSQWLSPSGQLYQVDKLRFDSRTMMLDLQDMTFASPVESPETPSSSHIDLSGTLFQFKDGSKIAYVEPATKNIQVEVDDDTLLAEKYQFVTDYAPQLWLSELDDGWWPGDLQTYFDNTLYTADEGSPEYLRLNTRVPLKDSWEIQPFFHGVKPKDGKGVACQTFIWPVGANDPDAQMDPLEMLLNPEESEVQVRYAYFFPYDYVSWQIQTHVGDIEGSDIYFSKGTPTIVNVNHHASNTERDYAKIAKLGKRPVLFNARGTHATYFQTGVQHFQLDWVEALDNWDLWRSLDIIFPWDFLKDDRIIKSDSNTNGLNYLTQIRRWGNNGDGGHPEVRTGGPSGFLDKFGDRKAELAVVDWVCEGMDTSRCPWPVGVFNTNQKNTMCSQGYFFSYAHNQCFIAKPAGVSQSCSKKNGGLISTLQQFFMTSGVEDETCSLQKETGFVPQIFPSYELKPLRKQSVYCGNGYQDACKAVGDTCVGECVAIKPTGKEDFEHFVCTADGQWVNATNFPEDADKVTFLADTAFNCDYDLF